MKSKRLFILVGVFAICIIGTMVAFQEKNKYQDKETKVKEILIDEKEG